jgi:hypothetical protein
MGHVEDAHSFQLEESTVVRTSQFPIENAADGTCFTNEHRPVLHDGESESCFVRSPARERAADPKTGGVVDREAGAASNSIIEREPAAREATVECGLAAGERLAAAPACHQPPVGCAVVGRAGYVGPADLRKGWEERGREEWYTKRPLG